MRINLPRWLIIVTALSIVSCTPAQEESHGSGFIIVNEVFWGANHDTTYPFTTSGEISCVYYPEFGTEVYFEPAGYSKDSSIGTPFNKAAAKSLKRDGMRPNVPYSIKKNADLNEAREIGLRMCEDIQRNF